MILFRRVALGLTALGFLIAAAPVSAQRITVQGVVRMEDGTTVIGAEIHAMNTRTTKPVGKTKSKKNGSFRMAFFPTAEEGGYRFKVVKDGLAMSAIEVKLLLPDRTVGATYNEQIGPHQELHEFTLRANGTAEVNLTMVPAERYAGAFSIPGDPAASKRLGEANKLSADGSFAESNAILEAMLGDGIEHANMFYLMGRNFGGLGKSDEMVRWFEKTLEANPAQAGVHGQLAIAAYSAGDKEAALTHYSREMQLSPDLAPVAVNHATLLAELGRDEQAVAGFEGVLEKFPGESAVYPELAALYFKLGRDEEGQAILTRLEESAAADPSAWYLIGARFSNRGQLEQAVDAYRKCLAIDPTHADATRELGFLSIRTGDKEGALGLLRKYLELRPDAPDAAQVRAIEGSLAKAVGQ
jgi:tetratricopeptide (TPR) repeat protein